MKELVAIFLAVLFSAGFCQGPTRPTLVVTSHDDAAVVYIMLLMLGLLNILTPIFVCIYQRYGRELVQKAQVEIDKMTSRISDRISNAGRKISAQMRV